MSYANLDPKLAKTSGTHGRPRKAYRISFGGDAFEILEEEWLFEYYRETTRDEPAPAGEPPAPLTRTERIKRAVGFVAIALLTLGLFINMARMGPGPFLFSLVIVAWVLSQMKFK